MDGNETTEREREQTLLATLRDLIDEEGHGGAARQLGVDRKTLWRVLDSGRLTPLVTKALERRGANPEAARRRSRMDELERQTKALDDDVEGLDEAVDALRNELWTLGKVQAEALQAWERRLSAVESRLAGGTAPTTEPPAAGRGDGAASALQGLAPPAAGREPVARPHRDHPEVVTLRAEEGEEPVTARPRRSSWSGGDSASRTSTRGRAAWSRPAPGCAWASSSCSSLASTS